jgi:predicted metal-binding protein
MDAFKNYRTAMILKTVDPALGQEVTLALEKEAMLSCGCTYAFAMVLCVQCEECACPDPCRYPHLARPSMDAYGVDIGRTVEPLGFKVEFDKAGKLLPAWYSMVLLD